MSKPIDLTNKEFGRLTPRWPVGIRKDVHLWLCSCTCGNLRIVLKHKIGGTTKSCGCWNRDQKLKHGHAVGYVETSEYNTFLNARKRCTNPKHISYPYYGGRGIKFLFMSFEEFLFAVGPKPSPQHTVDRYPNNDGHYESGNVRWATKEEQANNRRNSLKKAA